MNARDIIIAMPPPLDDETALAAGKSSTSGCPTTPVRISWLALSSCTRANHGADAIQVLQNEMLDAVDGIASDGLVQAGYWLLAVDACPALAHPSNRASIASYAFSRGLTLVFTALAPEALRPRTLDRSIFPHSGKVLAALRTRSPTVGRLWMERPARAALGRRVVGRVVPPFALDAKAAALPAAAARASCALCARVHAPSPARACAIRPPARRGRAHGLRRRLCRRRWQQS